MLKLTIAAVVALVIGFTVRDMTTTEGASPEEGWEARAAEVDTYLAESIDTGESLTDTGEQIKDWLLNRVDQKNR